MTVFLIGLGVALVVSWLVRLSRQADVAVLADELTRIGVELEADGWQPRHVYPCGCNPAGLCAPHAQIRQNLAQRRPGPLS